MSKPHPRVTPALRHRAPCQPQAHIRTRHRSIDRSMRSSAIHRIDRSHASCSRIFALYSGHISSVRFAKGSASRRRGRAFTYWSGYDQWSVAWLISYQAEGPDLRFTSCARYPRRCPSCRSNLCPNRRFHCSAPVWGCIFETKGCCGVSRPKARILVSIH